MADGGEVIAANRFVQLLDWSGDGAVARSPVGAVDRALASRKEWEVRVSVAMATLPGMEEQSSEPLPSLQLQL
jgi:hypothetical protein